MSIINKEYKKSILISQDGLFLYENKVGKASLIDHLASPGDPHSLLDGLRNKLSQKDYLNSGDEFQLIYHHDLFTTVPNSIYRPAAMRDYLKYNSRILPTDQLSCDDAGFETKTVFVGYDNINNYLFDQFGSFEYFHLASKISLYLHQNPNDSKDGVFIFLLNQSFYLFYLKQGKPIAINLFPHQAKEDVLYYLLFTLEQNDAITEETPVYIHSEKEESSLINLLKIYIKDVNHQADSRLNLTEIICA